MTTLGQCAGLIVAVGAWFTIPWLAGWWAGQMTRRSPSEAEKYMIEWSAHYDSGRVMAAIAVALLNLALGLALAHGY